MLPSLLSSLLLSLAAHASPVPFPHEVTTHPRRAATAAAVITQFRYSGSGCTQNSNSVAYSPAAGWTTQVYTFRQFSASGSGSGSGGVDGNPSASTTTENCELHFQGSGLGQGWQVSLSELDATGEFAGNGETSVNWFWQAYWSNDASNTLTLEGSIDSTSANASGPTTIKASVSDPLWSQCIGADGNPGILNVNFRVAVASGAGSFKVDSEVLKYRFRRCQ